MKTKVLVIILMLFALPSIAMEEDNSDPKQMFKGLGSLKFLTAYKIASMSNTISEQQIPIEALDFVNLIKDVLTCEECSEEEKYFLIDFIRHPLQVDDNCYSRPYFGKLATKYSKGVEIKKDGYYIELSSHDVNIEQLLSLMILYAARRNSFLFLKLLISVGGDVDSKTCRGLTALMISADLGCEAAVKLLISKGANVNAQDDDGYTALTMAVHLCLSPKVLIAKNIIKILLDNQADINIQDKEGDTALIRAVSLGRDDAVIELLNAPDIDINIMSNDGDTALMRALKKDYIQGINYKKIVEALSKKDENDKKNTVEKIKQKDNDNSGFCLIG